MFALCSFTERKETKRKEEKKWPIQGVCKHLVNFSGLQLTSFFGLFLVFWDFFDHSIWEIFHTGIPGAWNWKKSWKIPSSKKIKGCFKLAQFLLIEFWVWELPTLHSFISGISPSFFKIIVHILLQISSKLGTIVIKIYTEVRIEVFKYLLCYKCVIWSQS